MLELHSVNHLRIGVLHKVCGGALVPHVDGLAGLDVALDEVVVRGIENGGGGVQVDKRAVLLVIPAAVGLMASWSVIRANLLAYLVIAAVTTLAVMAVSGLVTQGVLRRNGKGEDRK